MENKIIHEIIILRYLDGSASSEEKKILLQWLDESKENLNDFNTIHDLWLSCDNALGDDIEINNALKKLKNRILFSDLNQYQPHQHQRKIIGWPHVAAIILVLLGMTYWLTDILSPEDTIQNHLITAKGSKGRFILPDSSIVWLNSESKLTYPEKFVGNKRFVELEGEGFFDVKHNKEKPFIVKSGDLDVEVLGTAFDISSYYSKNTIDIVLVKGSVKVISEKTGKTMIMKPDEILEYSKDSKNIHIKNTKSLLHVDWIKEQLVFDNTSLSDIIISIEGWFNISIRCPEKFASQTRMSFTIKGENIHEILNAMSLIIPIHYTIENDVVTIIPK